MKRTLSFITVAAAFMLLMVSIGQAESANSFFDQGFEKHQQGELARSVKLYTNLKVG